MLRIFFGEDIGVIQHLKYAFESRVPNEREKEQAWRRFGTPSLGSKAKPAPLKLPVKFKCQICSKLRSD